MLLGEGEEQIGNSRYVAIELLTYQRRYDLTDFLYQP